MVMCPIRHVLNLRKLDLIYFSRTNGLFFLLTFGHIWGIYSNVFCKRQVLDIHAYSGIIGYMSRFLSGYVQMYVKMDSWTVYESNLFSAQKVKYV